jgi:hypothetical protein
LLQKYTNNTNHRTQTKNKQQIHKELSYFCWRVVKEEGGRGARRSGGQRRRRMAKEVGTVEKRRRRGGEA